jgi:Histidine kinase/MASE1
MPERAWTFKQIWEALMLALASYGTYAIGLASYEFSGRMVSPIWPALGLGYGAILVMGPRALPSLWLGGTMCLAVSGNPWGNALATPLVDVGECLAAWWLVRFRARIEPTAGVPQAVAGFFLIPMVTSALAAIVSMAVVQASGFPLGKEPLTNWAVIASSRAGGMISVAPFVLHFMRGDYWKGQTWCSAGTGAVLQGLLVFLTVVGFLIDDMRVLPPGAAIYLPFVALILQGVFCPPAQAAFGLLALAAISTVMTALGYGPLGATASAASLFLLGAYQAGLGGMAYLLSTGTNALQAQARLLQLMTGSGRLAPWQWTRSKGLKMEENPNISASLIPREMGSPPRQLDWLGWGKKEKGTPEDDRWVALIEGQGPRGALFLECQGLVLLRDPSGRPLMATGVLHDLSEARRFRETQMELAYQQERLRGLQSQLNPHFLFNSLNTVRALIGQEPEAARQAVTALASILRATLQFEARTKVPLREELKVVRHFLRIQHLRHGDRLRSRIRLKRAASLCPIPPLLVLNMVENAIIHGIDKLRSGGTVVVDCELDGRFLHVRVTNPGELVEGERVGIGIENTRQRLSILYGPEAAFHLHSPSANLVEAHATIPVFSPP